MRRGMGLLMLMLGLRYAWWIMGGLRCRVRSFDLELAGAATLAWKGRERVGWWFGGGWGYVGEL